MQEHWINFEEQEMEYTTISVEFKKSLESKVLDMIEKGINRTNAIVHHTTNEVGDGLRGRMNSPDFYIRAAISRLSKRKVIFFDQVNGWSKSKKIDWKETCLKILSSIGEFEPSLFENYWKDVSEEEKQLVMKEIKDFEEKLSKKS